MILSFIAGCWLFTAVICLPTVASARETKHIGNEFLYWYAGLTILSIGVLWL